MQSYVLLWKISNTIAIAFTEEEGVYDRIGISTLADLRCPSAIRFPSRSRRRGINQITANISVTSSTVCRTPVPTTVLGEIVHRTAAQKELWPAVARGRVVIQRSQRSGDPPGRSARTGRRLGKVSDSDRTSMLGDTSGVYGDYTPHSVSDYFPRENQGLCRALWVYGFSPPCIIDDRPRFELLAQPQKRGYGIAPSHE